MKGEKCGQEILEEEDKGIKIVSRYNPEKVLFHSSKTTMKEAVEEAVNKGANLKGANLEDANLKGANLEDANLEGANLECANTQLCTINFSSLEYKQAKQFIEGLK